MSADDAYEREVERRLNERTETQRVAKMATDAQLGVVTLRRDMDDKIERLTHGIVDQLTDRWADKIELQEQHLFARVEARLKAIEDKLLTEKELPDLVKRNLRNIQAQDRLEARSNTRFWGWVVLSAISILSALGTLIFWAVQVYG